MLVDKTFSGKLNEYKDICRLMRNAFSRNEQQFLLERIRNILHDDNFLFNEIDKLGGKQNE